MCDDRARRRNRWLPLLFLALSVALIVIDGTIVGVSIPAIISGLSLGFAEAQWINSIYSLIFAALLITFGRLADRLGRRKLLAVGIVIFSLASLLAGAADSAGMLIFARAIQGISGAMILPSTLSTMNTIYRGKDRAVAFAVWGSVMAASAAVGPLMGGWLTESFSWRWIFYVNLILGPIILMGTLATIPETRAQEEDTGTDFSVLGIDWPATRPISLPLVSAILGIALLIGFVLWENARAHAGKTVLLDTRLFKLPAFRWGNLAALLVSLGEFGIIFTLPLYLQNVHGYSPLGSGAILAAMALGALLAGGSAGPLAPRIGAVNVARLGMAIEAIAIYILAIILTPDNAGLELSAVLVLYGMGLGFASAQLTSVILVDIPVDASGQGSAVQSTARQVGSALGAAVVGTMLASQLADRAPGSLQCIEGIDAGAAGQFEAALEPTAGGIITTLRSTDMGFPADTVNSMVDSLSQVFVDSMRTSMVIAGLFLIAGLACTLLIPRHSDPSTK